MTARRWRDGELAGRVRAFVSQRLGVDARALATFRAAVAAIVVVDLLLRARFLAAFYTDAGVLPRALLYEQYGTLSRLSLHALSGGLWLQVVLFALTGVTALAMLVGYRTTLATLLTGVLLTSLHYRNPLVLNSGDTLLRMLFLWGVFLPLGRRWSVDALHASPTEASGGGGGGSRGTAANRVLSVASAGVLLQVVVVYATNAVLKLRGDSWLSGDATARVLELDMFTVLLGDVLANYPALLRVFDRVWLAMLVGSVLLVVLTGWARAAFAGLFAAVHLGMFASMLLGPFPLVSVVALVPFLPGVVWDRLPGWRAVPGLQELPVSRFFSALARGLPAGGLPDTASVWAARRWKRRVLPPLLGVLLVGILVWNAATVGLVAVPDAAPVDDSPSTRWGMFAPTPASTDYWVVAPATLESGATVDAFHGGEVTWREPPDVARSYPSARWRKYVSNLRSAPDSSLAGGFADYLCSRPRGDDAVVSVGVYVVEQPVTAAGAETTERVELATTNCSSS